MKIEKLPTAADAVRGREALGTRHMDDVFIAAREFRRTREELSALRSSSSSADDPALQAALLQFDRARLAVRRAVKG
jgi:hypothetical protein